MENQTQNEQTDQHDIPDKFKDPETGELRVDALLKSYIALEKKLSEMVSMDDKEQIMKLAGRPDTPDEYSVDVSHGLFDIDPDLNTKLHGLGFTLEQVQAVYDLAAEKLVPLILELNSEFQADREVDRLIQEFGGPEKWKNVSKQLLAYGEKNLPTQVLSSLSGSYDGVMALYRMMKVQEPGMKTRSEGDRNIGEKDLHAMMRDPKYWQKKDPAFIAQVTKGFEEIYS